MSHVTDLKMQYRITAAMTLAPCFRDKFDFSEGSDSYNRMAEMAFKAADALIALSEKKLADAKAKDDSEEAERLKVAETARLKKEAEEAAIKAADAVAV